MRWPFRKDDAAEEAPLRPLHDAGELDGLGRHEVAVLYKHSPACWMSARALREVRAFAAGHPRTPVYLLDVIGQRSLARDIAESYGIRHQSPQAIVLRHGEPDWHGSHRGITAAALEAATGSGSERVSERGIERSG